MLHQQAHPRFDWGLLLVLVAVELDKCNFKDLRPGGARVQQHLVLQRLETIHDKQLKELVTKLRNLADWA